jgi:hypothetical protein
VLVWRYLDANEEVIGNSDLFEDQETAEAWLSAEWELLSKSGVEEVLLFDEDAAAIVYRMSLAPDEA